jgi:capsular polysaccharide biosynthesis protein
MTPTGLRTPTDEREQLNTSNGKVPSRKAGGLGLRIAIALVFVVLAGAVTYVVSSRVPATYKSTSELRVSVNGSNGLGQDSIQASNELTAQLVQLLPTNAVLAKPAAKLGMSPSALQSAVSVGSVAQQNLLEISATGSSPAQAQRRAATVSDAFLSYMRNDARVQASSYMQVLQGGIRRMGERQAKLESQLNGVGTDTRAATVLEGQIASIQSQQQTLQTDLAQREASSAPVIQPLQAAGAGSKVSPRPVLYAIVALVVAAFVAAQVLTLVQRRRGGTAF